VGQLNLPHVSCFFFTNAQAMPLAITYAHCVGVFSHGWRLLWTIFVLFSSTADFCRQSRLSARILEQDQQRQQFDSQQMEK
jgi:hypothetical protein